MENIDYRYIHPNFKLNGFSCDREKLRVIGITYIKEGELYMQKFGKFLLDWLNKEDYIEVTSSGTTGMPKQMKLKKQHLVNSAIITGKYLGLKPGNSALYCLPADFIAGKMMIVRAVILGLEMDVIQPSSHPLSQINKRYNFLSMTPMQALRNVDKLNCVDKLILGGAPISTDLEEKLQKIDCKVYCTYGMTETVSHIAMRSVNKPHQDFYKAMPHTSFEQDSRGCLVINCFKVADHQIITNDVVELINETEFKWKGRLDNVINSGGFKIFPESIETKLISHIHNRYFIWHEADDILGQKAVLFVEGDQKEYPDLLEIMQQDKHILKYEIPKKVYFMDKFKMTGTGKIQREETVKQYKINNK